MRLDHITPKQLVLMVLDCNNLCLASSRIRWSVNQEIPGQARDGLIHCVHQTSLPGGISKWEPPDPIPNSEVKLLSADDSVGLPHVKVGHCQAFYTDPFSQ